jgi:hypothetical protein
MVAVKIVINCGYVLLFVAVPLAPFTVHRRCLVPQSVCDALLIEPCTLAHMACQTHHRQMLAG